MYARGGRDVEGGGYGNDTNSNILEQQNNDRISELSEQVARLKVNKEFYFVSTRSMSSRVYIVPFKYELHLVYLYETRENSGYINVHYFVNFLPLSSGSILNNNNNITSLHHYYRALQLTSDQKLENRIHYWIKWEKDFFRRVICFRGVWQKLVSC